MKKDEKEEMHHAAKPEWKAAKSEWIELKDYRHCLHGCYRDSYHYCLCLRNSPCNGERLGGSLIVHWKRHLLYQRPYLRMLFHSFFFILCFFCLTFLNTVFSLSGLDNDRVLVRLVLRWNYEKVMREPNNKLVLLSQQHYFLYCRELGFLRRSAHASCRKVVPPACDVSRFHVDNWVIRLVSSDHHQVVTWYYGSNQYYLENYSESCFLCATEQIPRCAIVQPPHYGRK